MTAALGLAIPTGIALGLGLWTLLAMLPRLGAARLSSRVAPHLVDVSAEARVEAARRPAEPASVVLALGAPWVARLGRHVARVFGGDDAVALRLRQAGSDASVEGFRSRQLTAGAAGTGVGIAVAALIARAAPASGLMLAALVAFGAAAGLIAPDQLLSRSARARQRRIAAELPTVLEFLALALSAGEGILDALRRVSRTGNGELAREFGRVVAEVNTGKPLPESLARCAATVGLPALTRTVDQLVGALERGTPLVGVFRSQARDSRDDAKRHLIEAAGRKEVAMLVPLVFLILPVTIAFAIFPGILVLQLGF
ncbi:type II secretion system F family protein [soil metagenome]